MGYRLRVIGYIAVILFMVACREYQVSDDPSMRLSFSVDTLRFDTVFSEQGSATMQFKVYNDNKQALVIKNVSMANGAVFRVNIDGEATSIISTTDNTDNTDSVYDLQGRKVDNAATKGVYIQNGRKVVVK